MILKLLETSFLILCLGLYSQEGFAKKLELEDIQIKGQLHNDNRLKFYQRNRAKLENRVRIRTSFRDKLKKRYPLLDESNQLNQFLKD